MERERDREREREREKERKRWLDWSKLKAKVPKCRSLGLQALSGKRIDPVLSIAGTRITPVKDDAFKFLGMPVRVCANNQDARTSLKDLLDEMLVAIDSVPVTRQQKMRL